MQNWEFSLKKSNTLVQLSKAAALCPGLEPLVMRRGFASTRTLLLLQSSLVKSSVLAIRRFYELSESWTISWNLQFLAMHTHRATGFGENFSHALPIFTIVLSHVL